MCTHDNFMTIIYYLSMSTVRDNSRFGLGKNEKITADCVFMYIGLSLSDVV